MENFADRLIKKIKEKKSIAIVGLDPRMESMPINITKSFPDQATAIFEFNKKIIDAVCPHAVGVKLQVAFYELYADRGVASYINTVNYAKELGKQIMLIGGRDEKI